MGYDVEVSLNQILRNPMLCVVCGGSDQLNPRGYAVYGRTNRVMLNYSVSFFFPVCSKCSQRHREVGKKRRWQRTAEEKEFVKLYDKQAVKCWLYYWPVLGVKRARFTFFRKDYAEAFRQMNINALA